MRGFFCLNNKTILAKKHSVVIITDQTLQQIKLHYTEEYQKTLRKLKEIESVLEELSGVTVGSTTEAPVALDLKSPETNTSEQNLKPKRAYKKRSKRRGRKSVWGDFILKRLKSVNRPLTYNDLANHAIVTKNLEQKDFDKIRKALIAAVFQLRKAGGKVHTENKTGTRDKYVLLHKWMGKDGKPLPEFDAYLE